MSRLRITLGDTIVTVILNNSRTAGLVKDVVPFASTAQRWGKEVYFQTPVEADEETAQADVPSGTIAYWPPGRALCLFFGQEPYSPVNVVGSIEGDATILAAVKDGEPVSVEIER